MGLEDLETWLDNYVIEYAWSIIAVVIFVVGVYTAFKTGFINVKSLKIGAKLSVSPDDDKKNVSPFEAFCVAIGSHLGVGLVMGLGTAILLGGPGAIFWIWVMVIFGSMINMFESTLSQLYKEKGKDGMYYGGLPLVISKGLKKPLFAKIFILISITAVFSFVWVQTGSISGFFNENIVPDSMHNDFTATIVGLVITGIVALILFADLKKEARLSSKVVPFIGIGWILICLFMIAFHADTIIPSFQRIFESAFTYSGAVAGVTVGFFYTIMWGFRRGEYTLSGGAGLDAISAGSVKCKHPASQGCIQGFNALVITPLLITITALAIMTLGDYTQYGTTADKSKWYLLEALQNTPIGDFAEPLFFIVIVALGFGFVISGCIVITANLEMYGAKEKTKKIVFGIFLISVFLSCVVPLTLVWGLGDLLFGLATLAGTVSIFLLWKIAAPVMKDYLERKKTEDSPEFDPEKIPGLNSDGMDSWKK